MTLKTKLNPKKNKLYAKNARSRDISKTNIPK